MAASGDIVGGSSRYVQYRAELSTSDPAVTPALRDELGSLLDHAAGAVAEFNASGQLISQLWGVGTVIVWSGVVSFVLYKLIDLTMGLRAPEEQEREGLDTASHGERAYSV